MRVVGPFEVLEPLGAGGMGEVFKARDTRLNRFVALKFLPETATGEARERFQREAQAIAALNHPHICTLHEVGDDHGRPYLVLELLEGETLRARLRRAGALAPDQLLDWAIETADALDAAHRKGVLHRDLKPENLWVTSNGHIKVLDFGLARLEADDAGEAATVGPDRLLTSPGQTMGTIPYMSPEQARGEVLDARSDLFSFGSVLYEMAAGRPAFPARSAAETTAAILKEQPPKLSSLRPETPPMLEQVTSRCLEKDPELRYQSAADLRGELKRLKRESGSSPHASTSTTATAAAVPPAAPAVHASTQGWVWPAVAAIIVLAGGLAYWRLRPHAAVPPALQFRQLTFSGHVVDAVISSDGKFLAHVDIGPEGTSLHLQSVANGSDTQIMPPAVGCCQSPSFSPDGSQIYFREANALKTVPVLGGAVHTIADQVCSGAGFSPDGSQIAYIATDSARSAADLMLARADGSPARVLNRAPAGQGYISQCWANSFGPTHAPAWSPDGRWIAVEQGGASGEARLLLVSAADGHAQPLGPPFTSNPTDFNWLPDGSGLVVTASIPDAATSQLWEVTYPSGKMTQLTNDLQGYTSASLSNAGALALVHAAPQASIWVQPKPGGEFQPLPGGGSDQDGADGLDWTPNGLVSLRRFGSQVQLWAEASDGSGARALGTVPENAYDVNVAPNGQIIFGVGAATATVWRMNGDGSGLAQLMQLPAGASAYNPGLVLGGREVEYMLVTATGDQQMWGVPLAGGEPRQLWTGFVAAGADPVSPDGTRVFVTTRAANDKPATVIVRMDGSTPQVTPVVIHGSTARQQIYGWTPDGHAITFVEGRGTTDNIWAQPIQGGQPYAITHFNDLNIGGYCFARDGRLAISRGSDNRDVVLATGLDGTHHE